jgi:hypothetical protein
VDRPGGRVEAPAATSDGRAEPDGRHADRSGGRAEAGRPEAQAGRAGARAGRSGAGGAAPGGSAPHAEQAAVRASRPDAPAAQPSPAETTMRISRTDLTARGDGPAKTGRAARLAEPAMAETTLHIPRSSLPPASYSFQTEPVPIPLREELAGSAPTPVPETPPPPASSLLRRVPAGLIDSSLSSLGSFLMGLFATHFLTTASLGSYGLFYSAFIAVSVIPTGMVFSPVEYTSAGIAARHRRVQLLPQSLQLGAAPALMAALLVPLTLIIPTHGQPFDARLGFAVTAAMVAVVSPMQDHIRRMLHQAGMSWTAAATSFVQVVVVIVGLVTAKVAHVPAAWVPFGALAVANIVSGSFGLWKGKPGHRAPMLLKLRSLLSLGGWIVVGNVLSAGGPFINFALLTALASAADVGNGEASRVLAQPVTVLVVGLLAVLNPEIMEAANRRDIRKLLRICLVFWALVAVAIVAWALLVGFEWSINPLPRLQHAAYEVHGLLPLTILTEGSGYSVLVLITIANAAGRARAASVASLVAVVVSGLTVAVTARPFGAFALIWGAGATVMAMYAVNGWVVFQEFFGQPAAAGGAPTQEAARPAAAASGQVAPRPAEPSAAPRPVPPQIGRPRPASSYQPAAARPEPAHPQPDGRTPGPDGLTPGPDRSESTPRQRRGRQSDGGSGLRRPDVFNRR